MSHSLLPRLGDHWEREWQADCKSHRSRGTRPKQCLWAAWWAHCTQRLTAACMRLTWDETVNIPAWGGGGFRVPQPLTEDYWQLMTSGPGRISFQGVASGRKSWAVTGSAFLSLLSGLSSWLPVWYVYAFSPVDGPYLLSYGSANRTQWVVLKTANKKRRWSWEGWGGSGRSWGKTGRLIIGSKYTE